MESVEEKNDIIKFIEVASMKVKSAKQMPTKVVEAEQGKEYDPRKVTFSKISHGISIKGTCHSNDKKEKGKQMPEVMTRRSRK